MKAATAGAVVALLAACGGSADNGARPVSTTNETASTTTTSVLPARPSVGECRAPIAVEDREGMLDDRPVVPCDEPHGSETTAVLDLPPSFDDLDRDAAAVELAGEVEGVDGNACRDAGADWLGHQFRVEVDTIRAVVAVGWHPSLPDAEAWADGARWLRCEVVLEPFADRPPAATTASLRGAASDPRRLPPPELRRCRFGSDGRNEQVPCDELHTHEEVVEIVVVGLDPALFEPADPAGDLHGRCIDAMRPLLGDDAVLGTTSTSPGPDRAREQIELFGGVVIECSIRLDPPTDQPFELPES